MKKRIYRILSLALALIVCMAPLSSAAADDREEDAWEEESFTVFSEDPYALTETATWRTIGAKKNARLPVYTAPFPEAFRAANGKASLGTGESFTLLGTLQGGTWAMVEYSIDQSHRRVGWVELPAGAPQRASHNDLDLNRTPVVLTADASLTDDPGQSAAPFTVLAEGQRVIAMCVCRLNQVSWVYVETEAEGQVCWGFVPAQALSAVPEDALYRMEDGHLIIADGVSSLGSVGDDTYDDDNHNVLVRPGDIYLNFIDLMSREPITGVSFPDSLRRLGGEAIAFGTVRTLRLDGRLTYVSSWFTYACDVDEIVLAADYVLGFPGGERSSVGRWTVEPGNPRYSSRDGVLFSADGKTLLNYPNGLQATHYDVPRGTEEIAAYAFGDDLNSIPLKTISLPIGLKRIGANAFNGCGRLMSLAVPLTVTDLDPSAFEDCVSLERLSLPPGLQAKFDGGWAERGDFTFFNGDNGSTLNRTKSREEPGEQDAFQSYNVFLDNPEGAGDVPLYSASDGDAVAAVRKAGDRTRVIRIRDGRAKVPGYDWDDWHDGMPEDLWVPMANIRPDFGDVLFTISGAVLKDPAAWTTGGGSLAFLWADADGLSFVYGTAMDADTVYVPYTGAVLYRDGPNDGRTMGILYSDGPSIPLYEAPGDRQANHLYPLTQVLVLEESGEWLRIRTPDREGWIPAACFLPVLPKTNP